MADRRGQRGQPHPAGRPPRALQSRGRRRAAKSSAAPLFFEVHRLGVFTPRSLDIDVVYDVMIHDLDILLSLVDSPVVDLKAVGIPVITDKVDIAHARIEFATGTVANLTASRVSTERVRKMRFFQEHEYISLDFTRQDVLRVRVRSSRRECRQQPKSNFEKFPPRPKSRCAPSCAPSSIPSARARSPVVDGAAGRRALELADRVMAGILEHARRVQLGAFRPTGRSMIPRILVPTRRAPPHRRRDRRRRRRRLDHLHGRPHRRPLRTSPMRRRSTANPTFPQHFPLGVLVDRTLVARGMAAKPFERLRPHHRTRPSTILDSRVVVPALRRAARAARNRQLRAAAGDDGRAPRSRSSPTFSPPATPIFSSSRKTSADAKWDAITRAASVVVHIAFIIFLIFLPKIFPPHVPTAQEIEMASKNLGVVYLPPDADDFQEPPAPPAPEVKISPKTLNKVAPPRPERTRRRSRRPRIPNSPQPDLPSAPTPPQP